MLWMFAMLVIGAFGCAVVLDSTYINAKHVYVQGAADASTDAGAYQRYFNLGRDYDEFYIDPVKGRAAAEATFSKNMENMKAAGINTDNIGIPNISFPDNYSITLETDLTYEMKHSENTLKNVFDDDRSLGGIEDTINSTSNVNHRK